MKNLHVLATDKPSRLLKTMPKGNLILSKSITSGSHWENQHIYIISDEEIRGYGEIVFDIKNNKVVKWEHPIATTTPYFKKIILTTDQDLINDGVQAIDDEFLEWFVKNPSCEEVETKVEFLQTPDNLKDGFYYKIIIPKEEPILFESFDKEKSVVITTMGQKLVRELQSTTQEETLEEANWKVLGTKNDTFYNGAKWQQEDMIEKLEMHILINEDDWNRNPQAQFRNFIEQFKKK